MKITPTDAIQRLTTGARRARGTNARTVEFVRSTGLCDDSVYLLRSGSDGFVVPSDDDLSPILGEAEDADFTQELPAPIAEWVDDYAEEIEWWQLVGNTIAPADDIPQVKEMQDVPALVKTMWSQEYPYNYNLKMSDGKRSLVGCGPVALGMCAYYWASKGYRRGCTQTDAYTTTTNEYKVESLPPVTVFDYKDMTLKKPTQTANIKAVAALLEYCGKSAHADYKPKSTGAYETAIVKAIKTMFRLGDASIIYAAKLGLSAFCERIKEELTEGHPAIVSGFNSTLTAGHCFICDGYKSESDKFHFNWGWGGSYNGWFKMSALTPAGSRNYSYRKNAILFHPSYILGDVNGDGRVSVTDIVHAVDKSIKGEFDEKADVNNDGQVTSADATEIGNIILGKI